MFRTLSTCCVKPLGNFLRSRRIIVLRHLPIPPPDIRGYSQQWERLTSDIIIANHEIEAIKHQPCCSEFMGVGFCKEDFTPHMLNRWATLRQLVTKLALAKFSETVPDGASLPSLPLFRLVPTDGGARGSEDAPAVPILVLRVTALLRPAEPIFHTFREPSVDVGGTAYPDGVQGAEGFLNHLELTRRMYIMETSFRVELLRYAWVALDRVQITGVEDVHDQVLETCAPKARCKDPEFDFAKTFGQIKKKRDPHDPDDKLQGKPKKQRKSRSRSADAEAAGVEPFSVARGHGRGRRWCCRVSGAGCGGKGVEAWEDYVKSST